jgi:hypothetical protein
MIRSQSGSGRFEFDTDLFHFTAIDDHVGEVRCVIALVAVEDLTGDAFDPAEPMSMFERHETEIFDLAESVYVFRGLNERGVLAVGSHDTLRRLVL